MDIPALIDSLAHLGSARWAALLWPRGCGVLWVVLWWEHAEAANDG